MSQDPVNNQTWRESIWHQSKLCPFVQTQGDANAAHAYRLTCYQSMLQTLLWNANTGGFKYSTFGRAQPQLGTIWGSYCNQEWIWPNSHVTSFCTTALQGAGSRSSLQPHISSLVLNFSSAAICCRISFVCPLMIKSCALCAQSLFTCDFTFAPATLSEPQCVWHQNVSQTRVINVMVTFSARPCCRMQPITTHPVRHWNIFCTE